MRRAPDATSGARLGAPLAESWREGPTESDPPCTNFLLAEVPGLVAVVRGYHELAPAVDVRRAKARPSRLGWLVHFCTLHFVCLQPLFVQTKLLTITMPGGMVMFSTPRAGLPQCERPRTGPSTSCRGFSLSPSCKQPHSAVPEVFDSDPRHGARGFEDPSDLILTKPALIGG